MLSGPNGDRRTDGMPPATGAQLFHQRIPIPGLRPVYWRDFGTDCWILQLFCLCVATYVDLRILRGNVRGLADSKGQVAGIHKFEKATHWAALRLCPRAVLS